MPRRRRVPVSRLVAVVALAAGLVVGPALVAPAAFDACAAADASTVAVVVDFGTVPGSPGRVDARCVPPGAPNTGAQALADAGFSMRFAPSGLLCAIDGYPATGCGERTASGEYRYWAYWRATGGDTAWSYGSIGPGTARVRGGDVEGWRFVSSSQTASPSDMPRRAPVHAILCGTGPVAPAPSVVGSPAPAQPTDGGAGRASGTPGAAPVAPDAPRDDAEPPPDGDEASDGSEPSAGAADAPDASHSTAPDDSDRSARRAEGTEGAEQAMGDRAASDPTGGPWGLLVAGALVVGLGVIAVIRFRRDPGSAP